MSKYAKSLQSSFEVRVRGGNAVLTPATPAPAPNIGLSADLGVPLISQAPTARNRPSKWLLEKEQSFCGKFQVFRGSPGRA